MNCRLKACDCYDGWIHYATGQSEYGHKAWYIQRCTACMKHTSEYTAILSASQLNNCYYGQTTNGKYYITPMNSSGNYWHGFNWNNLKGIKPEVYII